MKKLYLLMSALTMAILPSLADTYTLNFAGSEDLYGLTREKDRYASINMYQQEFSTTQEGITFDFTCPKGAGFALVDCSNDQSVRNSYLSGLMLAVGSNYSNTLQCNVKVTDAYRITGIKLMVAYTNGSTYKVPFTAGDVETTAVAETINSTGKLFSFEWEKPYSAFEEVSFRMSGSTLNSQDYSMVYLRSVEVTYEPAFDPNLKPAGIAFPEQTLQLINGVEEIKGLVLENPNNLPVTYTSSNENILVSENGEISLAEGATYGTSVITAFFAGNSEYAVAEESYTLTVVQSVNSLEELKNVPVGLQAYVLCPLVAIYGNGYYLYVQSLDGNTNFVGYQLILGGKYKPNDIIPGNWMANIGENATYKWKYFTMDKNPKATETQEPVIPIVEEVTLDDVGKVVVLKNVTFEDATPATLTAFTGKVGETTYNFYNQFKVETVEPGVYDVKCGVIIGTSSKPRLQPIEIFKDPLTGVEAVEVAGNEARYYTLEGIEVANPSNGIYIKVVDGKASKVIIR